MGVELIVWVFSFLLQDHFLALRNFSLDFVGEQMHEVQLPLIHTVFKIWKLLDRSGFIWCCWRMRINMKVWVFLRFECVVEKGFFNCFFMILTILHL